MKQRDRDRLIKDFIAMLDIPEIEKIFRNKIEELKIQYKENLREYEQLSELVDPGAKTIKVQEFSFELFQNEIGWIPLIPGYDNPYKAIPKKVFDEILDSAAERGTILMNHPIKMPNGKIFEVTFEKHHENYYTGIIIEKQKKITSVRKKKIDTYVDEPIPTSRVERLKLLITYLLAHEKFSDYLLSEFKLKWKPLIDRDLITSKKTNSN